MPMSRYRVVKEYILVVILSLLAPPFLYGLWLLARMLLFDYFTIPTQSMSPTLQPGDKVIVSKLTAGARIYTNLHFDLKGQELQSFRLKGLRPVKRNDIVVFNFPQHEGKLNFVINHVYCKRVIGLPGDSVSAVDGHYHNNNYKGLLGVKAEQDYLQQKPDSTIYGFWMPPYEDSGWNVKNFGPMYIPRKDDVVSIGAKEAVLYQLLLEWETGKKVTWNWQTGRAYANGKPFLRHRFLHDCYFMAGDNVSNSNDSRYWGVVPEDYIIGIVKTVVRDHQILDPYEE